MKRYMYLLIVLVLQLSTFFGIVTCSDPSGNGNEDTINIVTYHANGSTGGTAPVDNNDYEIGSTVTVLGNTGNLIRTDCSLIGWNTQASGNGTTYTQDQSFILETSYINLYPLWSDHNQLTKIGSWQRTKSNQTPSKAEK